MQNANTEASKNFPDNLVEIIAKSGLLSATNILCRRNSACYCTGMSLPTYIAKDKKSMPEYTAEENRLILLLMANVEDDCRLKPLFVRRSANSRALKDLVKENLSVIKGRIIKLE